MIYGIIKIKLEASDTQPGFLANTVVIIEGTEADGFMTRIRTLNGERTSIRSSYVERLDGHEEVKELRQVVDYFNSWRDCPGQMERARLSLVRMAKKYPEAVKDRLEAVLFMLPRTESEVKWEQIFKELGVAIAMIVGIKSVDATGA